MLGSLVAAGFRNENFASIEVISTVRGSVCMSDMLYTRDSLDAMEQI